MARMRNAPFGEVREALRILKMQGESFDARQVLISKLKMTGLGAAERVTAFESAGLLRPCPELGPEMYELTG